MTWSATALFARRAFDVGFRRLGALGAQRVRQTPGWRVAIARATRTDGIAPRGVASDAPGRRAPLTGG